MCLAPGITSQFGGRCFPGLSESVQYLLLWTMVFPEWFIVGVGFDRVDPVCLKIEIQWESTMKRS